MDNNIIESCAARISKALSIRDMRQSELCKITGIPKSAISQYISGTFEPKQDRLFMIAQALNVSPVWLMGFDVDMEEKKENSPSENELTEGERLMLKLFRQIPADRQQEALEMLQVALKMMKKP